MDRRKIKKIVKKFHKKSPYERTLKTNSFIIDIIGREENSIEVYAYYKEVGWPRYNFEYAGAYLWKS